MLRTPTLFLIGVVSFGCETMSPQMAAKCANPDNLTYVKGGEICFSITTFRPFPSDAAKTKPTLIVFLHGDGSSGGPSDYMNSYATPPPEGTISIVMLRPGYFARDGSRSSGYDGGRRDHYTAANVDAIADAISTLRNKHESPWVVLVGHSGGAAIAGIIIGRHPLVADAALLISCPCDVVAWRDTRNSDWPNSLSPSSYVSRVAKKTRVVAITGVNDDNTSPRFARNYVESLRNRGIKSRFKEVLYADHGFRSLGGSQEYVDALRELIGSRSD